MTFLEYQKFALETAVYPKESGLRYTLLGLLNEIGEVGGKIKKVYRDFNSELNEEVRKGIAKEIGDVFWYLAVCSYEYDNFQLKRWKEKDIDREFATILPNGSYSLDQVSDIYFDLYSWTGENVHFFENDFKVESYQGRSYAGNFFSAVYEKLIQLSRMVGYLPSVVLEDNLTKLKSRKERGKIKGEGDSR